MTLNEIFNGKDVYFPGLIPLVYGYLEFIKCEYETFTKIDQYLKFISRYIALHDITLNILKLIMLMDYSRAAGRTVTDAVWMRSFVQNHPKYNHDSVVTNEIAVDLLKACSAVGDGSLPCPDVLGDVRIERYLSICHVAGAR